MSVCVGVCVCVLDVVLRAKLEHCQRYTCCSVCRGFYFNKFGWISLAMDRWTCIYSRYT